MQEPSQESPFTSHADAVAAPDGTREAEPAVEVELSEEDAELEELLIREITIDGMCGVY